MRLLTLLIGNGPVHGENSKAYGQIVGLDGHGGTDARERLPSLTVR
jgi:hypothetical protein